MAKHKGYASLHEGYGVLEEEREEPFDEIKRQRHERSITRIQHEAIDLAAVAAENHGDRVHDGGSGETLCRVRDDRPGKLPGGSQMSITVPMAFSVVTRLAERLGVSNIKGLPGCWEYNVDEAWTIALNGHGEPMMAEPVGSMGAEVSPFELAIWFNGWLAGVVGTSGGTLVAGVGANEDTFIAAVEAVIEGLPDAAV